MKVMEVAVEADQLSEKTSAASWRNTFRRLFIAHNEQRNDLFKLDAEDSKQVIIIGAG